MAITVVTDNYYDALRPDNDVATRYRIAPGASLHAEHGLSYFIETAAAGAESAFMLDYGADGIGALNNMRLLDIDFGALNALALSHGHFDHWGGLVTILEHNVCSKRREMPLYVGKEAFAHRFTMRVPGVLTDIGRLDQRKLEGTEAVRIVEIDRPTEIVPGAYLSGPIERITDYEHVPAHLLIERGVELQHDQFEGELAVAFVVKGKGLVVLSGCAHAGIVNTIRHCQKLTGVDRLHAVIGGFHLIDSSWDAIELTIAEIKAMSPDWIVPTHCTGFEATYRFRQEMAESFILNTAGTKYVFGA
jgi:7,8-dihydropterin-6-yl-methyl-4-(beta-D-ribofuranosyl)aminobenzene 5'-phosphate synthase